MLTAFQFKNLKHEYKIWPVQVHDVCIVFYDTTYDEKQILELD